MDNGYVIPMLNEDWTLLGAKMNEWMCGFVAFMLCSQVMVNKPARAMPVLIAIMVATSMGLAYVRRRFPDEEKGMRNFCFVSLGLQPPGIPLPAEMQPIWSGAPLRLLPEKSEFVTLGLYEVFKSEEEEEDSAALN